MSQIGWFYQTLFAVILVVGLFVTFSGKHCGEATTLISGAYLVGLLAMLSLLNHHLHVVPAGTQSKAGLSQSSFCAAMEGVAADATVGSGSASATEWSSMDVHN